MNQCNPRASEFSSGLYGLFRLDGGPVEHGDAVHLDLHVPGGVRAALTKGHDPQTPNAIHRIENDDEITIIVGEVHDIGTLAAELGTARDTPVAVMAILALERFGAEMPAHMLGEWSLLRWQDAERRLTLMLSAARRDRVHYAIRGKNIAVAADLHCLTGLPWVGNDADETAIITRLGISPVRDSIGDATIYRNIRQLLPGHSIVIDSGGAKIESCQGILPRPQRWTGSLDEAVEEADMVLRQIWEERTGDSAKPVTLLSGGIDSSLLAAYAADADHADFICSVAPPDSGIVDELSFAQIAADSLGGRLIPVYPPYEANTYRPPDKVFRAAAGPPLSNRQCLTEAFQQAARQHGGTSLVNGSYGEMSLTARLAKPGLRQLIGALLRPIRPNPAMLKQGDHFHVRLAPHRLSGFSFDPALDEVSPKNWDADLAGYQRGTDKALAHPNEFYAGALRMEFPFRDVRLLRFFSGLPLALLQSGNEDRLIARQLLKGRLPDSIRLRRAGMPASPDHMARLKRQAPNARARMAFFRKAQIDDWLDLDWLDAALARMEVAGPRDVNDANEVQLTTITAEWLCWWQQGR